MLITKSLLTQKKACLDSIQIFSELFKSGCCNLTTENLELYMKSYIEKYKLLESEDYSHCNQNLIQHLEWLIKNINQLNDEEIDLIHNSINQVKQKI